MPAAPSDARSRRAHVRRADWHVRAGAVVVAWLAAAVVAGAASLVRDVPTWLLLHLLLLGAVSNAILIWSSHFSAAMLRLPDRSGRREETARLALFNAGALSVVVGMTLIDVPMTAWFIVIAGGAVSAEAVIWHGVDLWRRTRKALPSRFGHTVRYYIVAALLLPFGIYIGLLMAPLDLPEDKHAQLALAHVALNVLGWMGLTVLGTLVTLWPTMLHTQVADGAERAARRALPVLAISVATIAIGALLASRPAAVAGVIGYLVGMLLLGRGFLVEARRRPPSTYATRSVLAALLWFVGCIVTLGVVVATASSWESAAEAADRLAAPLLVGFGAQLLIGALSFLIPVVLGGGPAMARATNALLDRGSVPRLALINGGVLLSLVGAARSGPAGDRSRRPRRPCVVPAARRGRRDDVTAEGHRDRLIGPGRNAT